MTSLRFVTWNFNLFNPNRFEDKVALLERLQPDVVALQEITSDVAAQLQQRFSGSTLIQGLANSGWKAPKANGAALLLREGIQILDLSIPALIGPESSLGADDAVPEQTFVAAKIAIGGSEFFVASAHPMNAAGKGAERERKVSRKLKTYAAIEQWVGVNNPVVLGMDANAWIDTGSSQSGSPFDAPEFYGDQQEIMHFFLDGPVRHGMVDAFRSWLNAHPEELAAIKLRRPKGPLATTYVRGGNYPVADRFDVVMISEGFTVTSIEHGYEDSLAAGSDHGYVCCDLELG